MALEPGGEPQKAFAHVETAQGIIENLLAQSPTDDGYHRNSAVTPLLFGQMLVRQNRAAEAVAQFKRAVELTAQLVADQPQHGEAKADLARAHGNLGHAQMTGGNRGEGEKNLRAAANLFEDLTGRNAEDILLQRDYAENSRRLGEALLVVEEVKF